MRDSTLAYYVVIGTVFIYNFFILLMTKKLPYLLYLVYLIFNALYFLSVDGIFGNFLNFSEQNWFHRNYVYLFMNLAILSLFIFSYHFLQIGEKAVKKYFVTLYSLLLGLTVSLFFSADVRDLSLFVSSISLVATILVNIYVVVKRKRTCDIIFLIAWSCISMPFLSTLFSEKVTKSEVSHSFAQIGFSIEAILMGIAIAERMRFYTKERESKAQQKIAKQKMTILDLKFQKEKEKARSLRHLEKTVLMITHDFQSPLAQFLNSLKTLENLETSGEKLEFMNAVLPLLDKRFTQVESLVAEILTFHGQDQIEWERASLYSLVQESIQDMGALVLSLMKSAFPPIN